MADQDPVWKDGQVQVIDTSGTAPAPDEAWSYGQVEQQFEYVAAAGGLPIPVAMYHYMNH